jgi:predicted nucleotidyltransferase
MAPGPIDQRFAAALAGLIDEVKRDRSVLAAVLCGSLSHDTVWEKSDIDLVLVTVDDRMVPAGDKALYADGVNIHALLVPRAEFRKMIDGAVRNSFLHSFLTKGRLLYTLTRRSPTSARRSPDRGATRRSVVARGDRSVATALQSPKMVHHAR